MKRIALILSVISIVAFQACKKSSSTAPTTQQLLQNSWQVQTVSTITHMQGSTDQTTNYTGVPGDIFDFRNDGKLYVSIQGSKDTSNYSIVSNNQFSVNGSVLANIATLTSNSLIFNIKTTTTSTDYDQATYTLAR